ncbi:MAG TPA: type II secretion system F family protein [Lacunisphaera sp.]|jgi:type IV pilus assembly protein PilC
MSLFQYRAYDSAGKAVTGSLEADSLATVETRLRNAGIWLLEAREGAGSVLVKGSSLTIKRGELINYFVQMSLLLRAGITMPNALGRLANDFEETKFGRVLGTLREKVSTGVPLHQAMAEFPKVFSLEITAIVQAGEVSGRMPEVFESLSEYYEWLDQLIGDVRQALIYPLMVIGASAALVLMLFTFVVPKFVGLLTDLNLKVPMLTRIVMTISNGLIHFWPVLIALIFGGPMLLKMVLRSDTAACAFDRGLMNLPIFGPLIAMFALSRFTHNLAMLYKAGIPLLRGLEICRKLVGNRAIEIALDDVRRGILEGTPFSKCLSAHDVFPQTLVTMISTGESSGTLDFALQSVSDYYNKIIPRRIKIVFGIFDPVMMISLIAVVGIVALSVILPILQLWDAK